MAHGTAIKALTLAGSSPVHAFEWTLPTQQADGSWTPGKWHRAEGEIGYRKGGFHVCPPSQLAYWTHHARGQQLRAYVVEYRGETSQGLHGLAARECRIVRPYAGEE